MIDMGNHKGQHLFYTGNRSIAELMDAGEIIAIPDALYIIIFKRTERATPIEKQAAYTLDEVRAIYEKLEDNENAT